jgi:hypothetical protein
LPRGCSQGGPWQPCHMQLRWRSLSRCWSYSSAGIGSKWLTPKSDCVQILKTPTNDLDNEYLLTCDLTYPKHTLSYLAGLLPRNIKELNY